MRLDLALYDDAALEALAPKGVVRRARSDLQAGRATIKQRDATSAQVEAEGHIVSIDARGPKAAKCTCPASGICRHVLVAVMALNADAAAPAESTGAAEAATPTATEELCALTQDSIQAFAGADWKAAVALAAASSQSEIQENGRNCTVEIAGSPASVTFLAGLGLKDVAFKGPKASARAVIAAAAILLRAKHGVALDVTYDHVEAQEQRVAQAYLDDAAQKLLQCTRMVLAGASPVAADTLFDLAISARAEAAPRLTARLRALTKQAQQAATRMIQFEPETFLADAAQTYALIEALKRDGKDPALTGVLRRDYEPEPAVDVWMLGASRWTTESGSRGLTLYAFAPAERQWRTVTQARGPGQDPTFDPGLAFTMPIWGAGSAKSLIGTSVRLPEPLISSDGAIAPTLPASAQGRGPIAATRALIEGGAATQGWGELRRDVSLRLGAGLRRRTTPIAALIAPAKFGPLSFDDFSQSYELEALDQVGDVVRLVFPADAHANARRLSEMNRPPLLLTETNNDLDRPALRPIALLSDASQGLQVVNFTLEGWSRSRAPRDPLEALSALLPSKPKTTRLVHDPLADLARRVLASATTGCASTPPADLEQLEQQCADAGLNTLMHAVRCMRVQPGAPTAMAGAYLASEALASLSWS